MIGSTAARPSIAAPGENKGPIDRDPSAMDVDDLWKGKGKVKERPKGHLMTKVMGVRVTKVTTITPGTVAKATTDTPEKTTKVAKVTKVAKANGMTKVSSLRAKR